MGGDVVVVASDESDFRADGTFYQQGFGGGGGSSITAGSGRHSVGLWWVDGATLSLTHPDGRQTRTSLYWAKNGDRVGGVPDVVWIGGTSYVLEE